MGLPSSEEYKENTIKIAEYLIGKGLPIENERYSALSEAILSGNKELFEFLLSKGANINHISKKCNSGHEFKSNPLFASIIYYKEKEDINDCKCNNIESTCVQFNNEIIIEELTSFEKIKNNDFIANKDVFLIKLLESEAYLNFTLDRNIVDNTFHKKVHFESFSPLTFSINNQLNEVAMLLISYGADVNMQDGTNKTPLIWAVELNNLFMVQLLLDSGADPIHAGPDNKTPIEIAYSKGFTQILDLLIEAESKLY